MKVEERSQKPGHITTSKSARKAIIANMGLNLLEVLSKESSKSTDKVAESLSGPTGGHPAKTAWRRLLQARLPC